MQKKWGVMLIALVLAAVFTGCEMETRTKVEVDSSTWVDAQFLPLARYSSGYHFKSDGTVYRYYGNGEDGSRFAYYYTGNPTLSGSTVTMLCEIQETMDEGFRDYFVEDDIAGYFTVGSDSTGSYITGDGNAFPSVKYYKQ